MAESQLYSQDFLNSLTPLVLTPEKRANRATVGVRVIHASSNERAKPGLSVKADELDPESHPAVTEAELPLALDDPRRIYASGLVGLRLTHPGGRFEGGLSQLDEAAATAFMEQNNISTTAELVKAVKQAQAAQIEELRRRLRAREEAETANRAVRLKIDELESRRNMERRVHEAMQARRKPKEPFG